MERKPVSKFQRILALAAAVILIGLYLLTLILAVTGSPDTMNYLLASLFASIVIPVFLYVLRMVIKLSQKQEKGGVAK